MTYDSDGDDSATTLGHSSPPRRPKQQQSSNSNPIMGAAPKRELVEEQNDDDDCQSIDLLLTQDEWSSEDDERDDEKEEEKNLGTTDKKNDNGDDDDFFGLATSSTSKNKSTKKTSSSSTNNNNNDDEKSESPPHKHHHHHHDDGDVNTTPLQSTTTGDHVAVGEGGGKGNFSQAKNCSPLLSTPATRTLDTLSQQSFSQDLRYEMSQLENDAASVMVQMKRESQGDSSLSSSSSSSSLDNKKKEPTTSKVLSRAKQHAAAAATTKTKRQQVSPTPEKKKNNKNKTKEPKKSKVTGTATAAAANNNKKNSSVREATFVAEPNDPAEPQLRPTKERQQVREGTKKPQSEPGKSNEQETSSKQPPRPDDTNKNDARDHPSDGKEDNPNTTKQQQQQRKSTNASAQKQVEKGKLDLTNWDTKHVIIEKKGDLGITVAKKPPPEDLVIGATLEYTSIKKAEPGHMGYDRGLRRGDWFLRDGSSVRPELAEFNAILERVRQNQRPLNLYVARIKTKTKKKDMLGLSPSPKNKNKKRAAQKQQQQVQPKDADPVVEQQVEQQQRAGGAVGLFGDSRTNSGLDQALRRLAEATGDGTTTTSTTNTTTTATTHHLSGKPQATAATAVAVVAKSPSPPSSSVTKVQKPPPQESRKGHPKPGNSFSDPSSTFKLSRFQKREKKKVEKAKREKQRINALLDADSSDSDDEDDHDNDERGKMRIVLPHGNKVVPFCKLCNNPSKSKNNKKSTTNRSVHHSLCPQNDFFYETNSEKILKSIIEGVNVGCELCRQAYLDGKGPKKSSAHSLRCKNWKAATRNDKQQQTSTAKPLPSSSKIEDSSSNSKQSKPSSFKKQTSTGEKDSKEKQQQTKAKAASSKTLTTKGKEKQRQTTKAKVGPSKTSKTKTKTVATESSKKRKPASNDKSTASKKKQKLRSGPGNECREATQPSASKASDTKPPIVPPLEAQEIHQIDRSNTTTTAAATSSLHHNNCRVAQQYQGQSTGRHQEPASLHLEANQMPVMMSHGSVSTAQTSGNVLVANQHATLVSNGAKNSNMSSIGQLIMAPTHHSAPPRLNGNHGTSKGVANAPSTTMANDGSTTIPLRQDSQLSTKSKWILAETNPWGPDGHLESDIVVLTPALGLGHYETELPSKRYCFHPFSDSAGYHKTHVTPQEGFHFLRLQRDTMATRSWGFSVQLHDFGGACLVEAVVPSSPAEAATFVGGIPDDIRHTSCAALQKNDMIIAINGKDVGGMTEQGLEIELDIAGPIITLVVSRYRFGEQLVQQLVEADDTVIAAIDAALNDDGAIGWVDIGANSSLPPPSIVGQPLNHNTNMLDYPRAALPNISTAATELPPSATRQERWDEDSPEARGEGGQPRSGEVESQQSAEFCQPRPSEANAPVGDLAQPQPQEMVQGGSGLVAGAQRPAFPAPQEDTTATTSVATRTVRFEFVGKDDCNQEEAELTFRPGVLDGSVMEKTPMVSQEDSREDSQGSAKMPSTHQDGKLCIVDKEIEGQLASCDSPSQHYPNDEVDFDTEVGEEDDAHEEQHVPGVQDGTDSEGDEDDEDSADGNPVVGCVCGTVHNGRWKLFCIQCDDCHTWYNVAKKCVGFSQTEANERDFSCWACSPPPDSDDGTEDGSDEDDVADEADEAEAEEEYSQDDNTSGRKKARYRDFDTQETFVPISNSPKFVPRKRRRTVEEDPEDRVCDPNQHFEDGTLVNVHREGSRKWGGDGHVVESFIDEDGERLYTVKYIIERYTESRVPQRYVTAIE